MDKDISATKSLPSGIYTTCEKDKRREKLNLKEDCKVLTWLNPHRCVDWRVNASMKTSSTHEEEGADIYQLLYFLTPIGQGQTNYQKSVRSKHRKMHMYIGGNQFPELFNLNTPYQLRNRGIPNLI